MSALRKNEMYEMNEAYEARRPAATPLKKNAGWLPVVIVTAHGTAAYEPTAAVAVEEHASRAKNIALFLASPFIGLAYLLAMPIVALAALAWFAGKALAKKVPASKVIALALAAPVIGLASVVLMPFVGIGALAWIGARRIAAR